MIIKILNGCCNGLADGEVVGDVEVGRKGPVSGHDVDALEVGLLVDVVFGSLFSVWAVVDIEFLVLRKREHITYTLTISC